MNDGAECASARSFIPLKEQTTCNVDDCPDGENHKTIKVLVIIPMNVYSICTDVEISGNIKID